MFLGTVGLLFAYFVFQHKMVFFIMGLTILLALTVWQMTHKKLTDSGVEKKGIAAA